MKKGAGSLFLLFFCHASWAASTDISQLLRESQTSLIERRVSQAEQQLLQLLQQSPNNVDALFLLGYSQIQSNQLADAQNTFTKLIASNPDTPDAYNNLAWIHAKRGEIDTAIDLLRKGINTRPPYVALYNNLTRIYQLKASQAYVKALEGGNAENASTVIELQPSTAQEWTIRTEPPAVVASAETTIDNRVSANVSNTRPALPIEAEQAKTSALDAIKSWAQDWSDQNIKQYLSHYDDAFQTPQSLARHLWEKQRRDRILGPKFIHVDVNEPVIEMATDGSLASVTFIQVYRSDNINQRTKKLLVLRRQGSGEWRILNEYSES